MFVSCKTQVKHFIISINVLIENLGENCMQKYALWFQFQMTQIKLSDQFCLTLVLPYQNLGNHSHLQWDIKHP